MRRSVTIRLRMSMAHAMALVAMALAAAPAARAEPGAPTCRALLAEALAASRARDVGRAEKAYKRAHEAKRGCTRFAREIIGRAVAHAYYRRAFADITDAQTRARLLEKALTYGRPWRLLAAMGDVYRDRKAWAQAARAYQEALDDMRDVRRNPKPAPIATFRAIRRRAETALLMAGRMVAVTNKAGELGGVLDYSPYRGWTSMAIAVPITFEYNSTRFTPDGEHAAKMLFDSLEDKKAPITLIGHTDPRGTETYNLRLSKRRAKAVRDWIRARGYRGRTRTEGRGEAEPYQPDDPSRYPQSDRFQMDRRVVLEWR